MRLPSLLAASALLLTACLEAPPMPEWIVADAGADAVLDTGTGDVAVADPGTTDAGSADPGLADPGVADQGAADLGLVDPGVADLGTPDIPTDPGVADPGVADPGVEDLGVEDAGFDAGCTLDEDCAGFDDPCLEVTCMAGTCEETPLTGVACDDGDACTSADVCVDGACAGEPYTCTGAVSCETSTCDGDGGCVVATAAGECSAVVTGGIKICAVPGQALALFPCVTCLGAGHADASPTGFALVQDGTTCDTPCVSGGSCTSGFCAGGADINEGGACDDMNACTTADVCTAGTCEGVGTDCLDGDSCTLDRCEPTTGQCEAITASSSGVPLLGLEIDWATAMTSSGVGLSEGFVLAVADSTTFIGQTSGDLALGGTTLPAVGSQDLVLLRHDAGGVLAWSRRVGGPTLGDTTTPTAVAQAPSGFAVAGFASAGADFGEPGSAAPLAASGRFVARYASDTLQWLASYAGPAAGGITVLSDGSVLVAGVYDDAFSVPAADGTLTLQPAGATNLYVGKVLPSGEWAWLKRVGQSSDLSLTVSAFAAEASGAFVLAGSYSSPLALGGPGQEQSAPNPEAQDAFVARFYSDGTLDWHQEVTGSGNDRVVSLDVTDAGVLVHSSSYKATPGLSTTVGSGENAATFTNGGQGRSIVALLGAADGDLSWAFSAVISAVAACPFDLVLVGVKGSVEGVWTPAGGTSQTLATGEGGSFYLARVAYMDGSPIAATTLTLPSSSGPTSVSCSGAGVAAAGFRTDATGGLAALDGNYALPPGAGWYSARFTTSECAGP